MLSLHSHRRVAGFTPVAKQYLLLGTCCRPHHNAFGASGLFLAKKNGKSQSGKSNQGKKGGFEWAKSFTVHPTEAKRTTEVAETAVAAYMRISGRPLSPGFDGGSNVPKALWNAPVACLVVAPATMMERRDGTEGAANNGDDDDEQLIVKYANSAALETLGLNATEYDKVFSTGPDPVALSSSGIQIKLPTSIKGDKKLERGYRKKISDDVTIIEADRWSLETSMLLDGKLVTASMGVAYAWEEWMKGATMLCKPGGISERIADGQELGDLDERIAKQGEMVRDLKENKGLGNKDQAVMGAVSELLRLKALKQL